MVYTLTFNPSLDYYLHVKQPCFEKINRASRTTLSYGGKGINVSAVLTELGVKNTALGFTAGFTGTRLTEMLREKNIESDFVVLSKGETRINVKLRAERELDINAEGPEITRADMEKLLNKTDYIKSGDFFILSGSVPETAGESAYAKILSRLENKGINFVVDATGNLLKNTLKFKPFLVKPNQSELEELFGVRIKSERDVLHYAAQLQTLGAKNVLVSRGRDGAVLLDEKGGIHTSGNVQGNAVNTTGCGDSMLAGFVAGYMEKCDFAYAFRLGVAAGNASAFSPSLCTRSEIYDMLKKLPSGRFG